MYESQMDQTFFAIHLFLFLVILLVELVMEENRSLPQTVRRMVNNAGGLTEKGKILLL